MAIGCAGADEGRLPFNPQPVHLWAGREVCRRQFFGAADMMHVCGALFMFVHGDRFMNRGADPACPAGGLSFWSTQQGAGVLGEEIAET